MNDNIKASLIAPCGMNCALCIGYQHEKNKCSGCNSLKSSSQPHCFTCSIRQCNYFRESNAKYCFGCPEYPCKRLKALDKRYSTKYHMSMLENLNSIKEIGIRKFVLKEKAGWICPGCDGTICVHRDHCLSCGANIML